MIRTREDLEFLAIEAAQFQARQKELAAEMGGFNKFSNFPLVETLEEAQRYAALREERRDVMDQLQGVAERLAQSGLPDGIWLKICRDGEPETRLRWWSGGNALRPTVSMAVWTGK